MDDRAAISNFSVTIVSGFNVADKLLKVAELATRLEMQTDRVLASRLFGCVASLRQLGNWRQK